MTLKDKDMTTVDESITVNMYDNGFMVEVSGRDSEDEWTSAKILCDNLDEVMEILKEATTIERR